MLSHPPKELALSVNAAKLNVILFWKQMHVVPALQKVSKLIVQPRGHRVGYTVPAVDIATLLRKNCSLFLKILTLMNLAAQTVHQVSDEAEA